MTYKYIWISANGTTLPIAQRLKDEGNVVYIGMVKDFSEHTMWGADDNPITVKKMAKRYANISDKKTVNALIAAASALKNKDEYRVICDTNALYPVADKFRAMGFKGLLPHKSDYELESDRNGAKELVKELYPDLSTGDSQEFKTIDEVEKFLSQNEDKFYVAKGNHEDAAAIVPNVTDAKWNHNEILTTLKQDPNYEKKGIVIEEKVMDIVEFCPEAIAYDGKVVSVNIDLENKAIGAGNVGFQTGDSGSVSFWLSQSSEIYEKFLQPLEKKMLRKGEMTVWDANVAYSPSRQKFYFLEFCPNRLGYNAVFNELATLPSVTDYFESIFNGESVFQPTTKKFGASLQIFNLLHDSKGGYEANGIVQTNPNRNIWLTDVNQEGGIMKVVGYEKDLAVITGAGDTLDEAFEDVYNNYRDFGYSKGYNRPKHDVLSTAYPSSIPNRYNTLKALFPEDLP